MNPTNYINTHNTTFIIFLITSKTHIHTHNGTQLHVHRQGIQSQEEKRWVLTTLKPIWSHSRRHSILKLAVDEAIEVGVVGGHNIIKSHAQRLHPQ